MNSYFQFSISRLLTNVPLIRCMSRRESSSSEDPNKYIARRISQADFFIRSPLFCLPVSLVRTHPAPAQPAPTSGLPLRERS